MMPARLELLFDRYRRKADAEALARVFDQTAPALFRVALQLSRNREQAEDLLQETFLTVIEKAERYDRTRPLVPWLLGILAVEARRRRRVEARAPDPERLPERASPPVTRDLEERELEVAVRDAMADLPEPYREVLRLHLAEDLAPVQVARVLGRSGNTVRTQIRRGLALLRQGLPAGLAPALVPLPSVSLARIREVVLHEAALKVSAASSLAGAPLLTTILGGLSVKKILFSIAGVVIAMLGAYALLRPADAVLPEKQPDPGATTSARDATVPTPGERDAQQETPPRSASPTTSSSTKASRPLALFSIPEGETIALQVVEEGSGKPLPGARVAYLIPSLWEDAATELLLDGPRDATTLIAEQGRQLVADERGEVRLPCVPWSLEVHGEHAGRSGSLCLHPDTQPPFRLALSAVRTVTIQVVDDAGTAVPGIPVSIVALARDSRRTIWRGVTSEPTGTIQGRYTQAEADSHGKARLFAALHAPFPAAHRLEIPETGPGAEPLRLVLPPTGCICVTVRDHEGHVLERGCKVSISCVTETDVDGLDQSSSLARSLAEGRVRFEHVPLGAQFRLAATATDPALGNHSSALQGPFAGPVERGEVKELALDLDEPHPPLRGRVLHADGTPVRDRVLIARVAKTEGPAPRPEGQGGRAIDTDEQGRFAWRPGVWTQYRNATRIELELVLWEATGQGGDARGPWGSAWAAGPFPPEGTDLGDIVLRPETLLLAGAVRDAAGSGVESARIALDVFQEAMTVDGPEGGWRHFATTRSGTDGRFSFACRVEGRLRVRSWKSGYFESPAADCLPGACDVELVMRRAGSVRGRFLLDPDVPTADLEAVAVRDDDDQWGEVRADGSFEIRGLEPGTHGILLRMMDQVLHDAGSVAVEAGEPTTLPTVDLRGRFKILRLRIRGHGDAPPTCVRIAEARPGSELLFEADALAEGRLAIPVPREAQRFVVSAQDSRPLFVEWRQAEQEVRLEADLVAQVRWQASIEGLRFDGDLGFHFVPMDEKEAPAWLSLWSPPFEILVEESGAGEIPYHFPCPGSYRVVWTHRAPDAEDAVEIPGGSPGRIEVTREGQIFEVSISRQALRAFFAR